MTARCLRLLSPMTDPASGATQRRTLMQDSGERATEVSLGRPLTASQPQPRLRENRATHGPHDQAARGHQGLSEVAKTVAAHENAVG